MMQNSSSVYAGILQNPQFPIPEQLKCPRCESTNTKFCYYNNYNLSQPRHFCKNCKRYWTKGGVLRNVPVGGGSRKKTTTKRASKRPQNSPNNISNNTTKSDDDNSTNVSGSAAAAAAGGGEMTRGNLEGDSNFGGQFGDFSSNEGQFGNSIDNGFINEQFDYPGLGQTFDPHLGLESGSIDHCDGFLNIHGGGGGGDAGCWGGGSNEWPNAAIYNTPGSTFQ